MGLLIAGVWGQSINAQIDEFINEWHERTSAAWESIEWSTRISLNRANFTELKEVGFNTKQAQCIIEHRQKWGEWSHETELQQCQISLEFIRKHRNHWSLLSPDARIQYLQTHKGKHFFPEVKWTTSISPFIEERNGTNYHSKVQASWGNWSRLGYIIQSDAGEEPGDYQSAAWEFKSMKKLKHLVLGRFLWNWNQGLVFSAPYAVGRSFDMGSWVHNSQSLNAALSQNEDQGIWGIGSHWKLAKNEIFASFGTRYFDSRINEKYSGFDTRVYGGVHITELEKSRRNNNQFHHGFIAWQRHFANHSLNVSHTRYTYKIPRIFQDQPLKHEHVTEYQHTFKHFLGGRVLFNTAITQLGVFSYYVAGAWNVNPRIDISLRTQYIPENFFAPERSPYSQSDNGKEIKEYGIDFNPNPNHKFQLRSQIENQRTTIEYPLDKVNHYLWIWQYTGQLYKKDVLQIRWKSPYNQALEITSQLMMQAKIQLHPKWKLRLVYISQNEGKLSNPSTLLLAQLGGKIEGFQFQMYSATFQSTSPLYVTLPSAQFPWKLGLFNGAGNASGLVIRQRIHRNLRLLFSVDYVSKKSFTYMQSQKPRIFVQLEIL